jgi:parallel beta-helix repeat protein
MKKTIFAILLSFLFSFVVVLAVLPELSTPSTAPPLLRQIPQQSSAAFLSSVPSAPQFVASPNALECGSVPTDGCTITVSTTFTAGVYQLPNGIAVLANNIILDCNNAQLQGSQSTGLGIYVNSTNVTIRNCLISNYSYAIDFANGINITKNRFMNNVNAINVGNGNVSISWNNFTANKIYGLWLVSFDEVNTSLDSLSIQNNKFSQGGGMYLDTSRTTTVFNNTIQDNLNISVLPMDIGMHAGSTNTFLIAFNTITNNSGSMEFASNTTIYLNRTLLKIYNNTIRDKGIALYYVRYAEIMNNSFINISSGSTDDSQSNPVYLSNSKYVVINYNYINGTSGFYGKGGYAIVADDILSRSSLTNDYITIANNIITKSTNGAIVLTGIGNTISGNSFLYNGPLGIWLVDTNSNFTISNNYFLNNSRAVLTDISGYDLNSTIENGTIFNNTITNSSICGLWIRQKSTKIMLFQNFVHHNNAGICIEYNNGNNTVKENNLTANIFAGLHFFITHDNKIYLNNIYGNTQKNTESDAATELQYDEIGNYWGHASPPCYNITFDGNRADLIDRNATCIPVVQKSTTISFPNVGWYFFSFFVQPNTASTATLLKPIASKYEIVQAFLNGSPSKYIPGAPSSLTKLDSWHGYWIKVNTMPANDLVFVGNKTTVCHPLGLTGSTAPKQWVGYWVDQPKAIDQALVSIAGNYEYVKTFSNGVWQTYNPILPQFSDLWMMVPGQAYLIKMTNPDALDYLCGG